MTTDEILRSQNGFKYRMIDRLRMDLKAYINTMSRYCGNCTEKRIWYAGNLEKHIDLLLRLYKTVPRPEWLTPRKLHRICGKAITLKYREVEDVHAVNQ